MQRTVGLVMVYAKRHKPRQTQFLRKKRSAAPDQGVRAGFGAHAGKERRALSPTDEDSHAAHFSGSRRVLSAEVENV